MKKVNKFIINSLILTASSFIVRTLGVTLNIFISGKIGAEGMGVFQLIMSLYMFSVILSTCGIGITVTRLITKEMANGNFGNIKSCVSKCCIYSLFFSISTSLLLYFNADFITSFLLNNRITSLPIYAFCVSLPFVSLSAVFNGYFIATRKIIKSESVRIFEQILRIALTIFILNLFMPKGLTYRILAITLSSMIAEMSSFIMLFIKYLIDKKRYKKSPKKSSIKISKVFGLSLPIATSSLLHSVVDTYKQIITPKVLQKSGLSFSHAIAEYGIINGMAFPIIAFPATFMMSFGFMLLPEISESHAKCQKSRINYIVSRIFKTILIFSVCVSGIFMMYSNEISMLIYKNDSVAKYFKIFAPLIVIMYLDHIVDNILKGLDEQVYLVKINILVALVSIILLHALIPSYGISGYIMVLFIHELVNGFLSINRLIKVTNFKLNLFEWFIYPSVVIITIILIIKSFFKFHILFSLILSITLYLSVLYFMKILKKEDFKI